MTGLLFQLLDLALAGLCLYGVLDAVRRPAGAFPAHGKLTKNAWLAILVVAGVVILGIGSLSFLGIPAIVAAIVYQVDVKPAVSGTADPW